MTEFNGVLMCPQLIPQEDCLSEQWEGNIKFVLKKGLHSIVMLQRMTIKQLIRSFPVLPLTVPTTPEHFFNLNFNENRNLASELLKQTKTLLGLPSYPE